MEEDSIELIDYLRVVWKYRYLILIGVVLCAVVAAAWSFSLPKLYKVSTILEVNLKAGKDFPSAIAANIRAGMFDAQVQEEIAKTSKNSHIPHLSFKVSDPKRSNMVRITYETADIKMGKTILEFLNKAIIDGFKKEADEIKPLILLNERATENIKARIDAISNQIELIDNTIVDRGRGKKSTRIEDVDGLILLRSSLRDSLLEQEILLLETEGRLAKLRASYEEGGPVRVIQKPTSSSGVAKPKIKLNILLAFVVGLFFSIFLAFFLEYFQKMGTKSQSSASAGQAASVKNQEQ